MAEHKIRMESYYDYFGIKEAGKDLNMCAAGNDALALLKKQYIGFGDSIERPHPQSAGTTKSQRRVGTRKRPKKKTRTSTREITCVLERN